MKLSASTEKWLVLQMWQDVLKTQSFIIIIIALERAQKVVRMVLFLLQGKFNESLSTQPYHAREGEIQQTFDCVDDALCFVLCNAHDRRTIIAMLSYPTGALL